MIEVALYKHNTDCQAVLVDANDATVVGEGDQALLILNKDSKEVAWFQSWVYAVKADNLMEYTDE